MGVLLGVAKVILRTAVERQIVKNAPNKSMIDIQSVIFARKFLSRDACVAIEGALLTAVVPTKNVMIAKKMMPMLHETSFT
jgi:hypothetical protein